MPSANVPPAGAPAGAPAARGPLTDADLADVPGLLHGQTFEEMVPGSRFRTASRTITETDLITFVTLAGMNEPLFLDEAGPRGVVTTRNTVIKRGGGIVLLYEPARLIRGRAGRQ